MTAVALRPQKLERPRSKREELIGPKGGKKASCSYRFSRRKE